MEYVVGYYLNGIFIPSFHSFTNINHAYEHIDHLDYMHRWGVVEVNRSVSD
jgi:hypothetical protein